MDRREFRTLSLKLKNEVTAANLKGLKAAIQDDFGAAELEQMHDFLDVWNALERSGKIAPGNLHYLISNFEHVNKAYTVRKILHNAMGYAADEYSKPQHPAREQVPKTKTTKPVQPDSEHCVLGQDKYFQDPRYDCPLQKENLVKMKNRGIMLIINQFKRERCGTEEDVAALKILFEVELDFHVDLRQDQTKDEVIDALKDKVRMMNDNLVERFFCVILSHGDEHGIWCTDSSGGKEQRISLEKEILPMFRADKLPSMKDRPKVFIVQACRGLDYHKGITVSDAGDDATPVMPVDDPPKENPAATEATDMNPLFIPNEADFLVAYPQTDGYKSFRNTKEGSWFIQTLVNVFKACYKDHDLLSMLTEVNNQVSKMFDVTRPRPKTGTPDLQMPCFMSSLRKKLFLT
ncbi:caspase-3-like isoform X2 [Lineus longissimus]|uniref:caspase-3-like isoform X2 n=1 Tax=Lineus longissimus TaxID=88925 RepID=UPI00315D02D7